MTVNAHNNPAMDMPATPNAVTIGNTTWPYAPCSFGSSDIAIVSKQGKTGASDAPRSCSGNLRLRSVREARVTNSLGNSKRGR